MHVIVDRVLCENHGLCAIAAPAVFQMDDEGVLVYQDQVDDSERPAVEDAAGGCPVQAILIAD